ncbi:protein kinase [Candidatus Dependentiae bacterium]|nr:protein kinase [Candidatus Dependentiae bacterium]MBU4387253.1 protein kinase [Candidatus Dependentiae bacterium]MCG2756544.1 protein kinase [Candidatus Dependentiae bacterium]
MNKLLLRLLLTLFFLINTSQNYLYPLNITPKKISYKNEPYELIVEGSEKNIYLQSNYEPTPKLKIKLIPDDNEESGYRTKIDIVIDPQKVLLNFKNNKYDNENIEKKHSQELSVLERLKGKKNIVQLLRHKKKSHILVLEKAKEDLFAYLGSNEINLINKIKIIKDIAYGIKDLHENNILHRDLKIENILIFEDENKNITAKLCDFSLSKYVDPETKSCTLNLNKIPGTFLYISPNIYTQIIKKIQEPITTLKDDIYAFAYLMYLVMYKRNILDDEFSDYLEKNGKNLNTTMQLNQFVSYLINYEWRPILYEDENSILNNLIEKCWAQEPEDRPDIEWVCDYLDNVFKELEN